MATRTYKLYADALVSVHFLWTLCLIGGVIAMLIYPPYATIQMMTMGFTLLISLPFGRTCPLTLFEEKLRKKIDPAYRNNGSYLTVYINKFFKTNLKASKVHAVAGGLYTIAFAIAIAILIWGNGWY